MFTIENIMDMFLTESIVESMGNWYPRVLAVMSCVIPTAYILFTFITVGIILACVWKVITK